MARSDQSYAWGEAALSSPQPPELENRKSQNYRSASCEQCPRQHGSLLCPHAHDDTEKNATTRQHDPTPATCSSVFFRVWLGIAHGVVECQVLSVLNAALYCVMGDIHPLRVFCKDAFPSDPLKGRISVFVHLPDFLRIWQSCVPGLR